MELALEQFLADTSAATKPAAITKSFLDQVGKFGFRRFSYVARGKSEQKTQYEYVATNYPKKWNAYFIEKRYFEIDPTLERARQTLMPFAWSDMKDRRSLTGIQRQLFDEASSFGLRHGFTVPIHAPGGADGLVALATDLAPREFAVEVGHGRHMLHLLALHYHMRATAAWQRNSPAGKKKAAEAKKPSPITLREADCLLWTARGKSAWETAVILGVSERTVNFHIENARRKLDAQSKTQAVVRAIMLNLIRP
jgi:LuxR family transcriptional activator of conjugal transfer of Ti plasmids